MYCESNSQTDGTILKDNVSWQCWQSVRTETNRPTAQLNILACCSLTEILEHQITSPTISLTKKFICVKDKWKGIFAAFVEPCTINNITNDGSLRADLKSEARATGNARCKTNHIIRLPFHTTLQCSTLMKRPVMVLAHCHSIPSFCLNDVVGES